MKKEKEQEGEGQRNGREGYGNGHVNWKREGRQEWVRGKASDHGKGREGERRSAMRRRRRSKGERKTTRKETCEERTPKIHEKGCGRRRGARKRGRVRDAKTERKAKGKRESTRKKKGREFENG